MMMMMMDVEGNQHQYTNHHSTTKRSFSCFKCLCQFIRLARFLPFVLISSLYIWGVYVYLYYVIYSYYEQLWAQLLLVLFFIPFYSLSFISYIKCVFTAHRPISSIYNLPEDLIINQMTENERNQRLESYIQMNNLPIFTRAYNGYVRYCPKCLVLKPDRAHHCSTCGRCICKMDHHCHWVSNCVAFDNYKFFILFLFYTSTLCLYVVTSSVNLFIKFWKDEMYPGKFQVFFLVLFCLIFSMSILILLSYHIYLVMKNVTTLESYQTPRFRQYEYENYRFNLGCKKNLTSVFGDKKLYWLLPIYNSLGDGHFYELKLITNKTLNHAMNDTSSYVVDQNNSPALLQHQNQQQQYIHEPSYQRVNNI